MKSRCKGWPWTHSLQWREAITQVSAVQGNRGCGARWPAKSNRIKASHRSDRYAAGDYPSPVMKRPKPATSCTKCGAPGYSPGLANGKCGRMVNWKRCKGTNQSAIQENDWAECLSCAGSGYKGAARCIHCDSASGWVFAGDRRL
jgi:hypothetical protein